DVCSSDLGTLPVLGNRELEPEHRVQIATTVEVSLARIVAVHEAVDQVEEAIAISAQVAVAAHRVGPPLARGHAVTRVGVRRQECRQAIAATGPLANPLEGTEGLRHLAHVVALTERIAMPEFVGLPLVIATEL